jgi:hypothetical protein
MTGLGGGVPTDVGPHHKHVIRPVWSLMGWCDLLTIYFMRFCTIVAALSASGCRTPAAVMRLPESVLKMLPMDVKNHAIFFQAAESNWNAFRGCYPSEEASLQALELSVAVILPYGADSPTSGFLEQGLAVDRSENIAGSYSVLQETLADDAEVLDVISKNPGVLGCVPRALESASADDILRAASIASGVTNVLGGARRFLTSQSWWDEGASKRDEATKGGEAQSVWDPLGLSGDKGGAEEGSDDELLLPTITLEGVEYMYDWKGDFNGIEHVLLTMEGEPVGVWNPETQEPEEVEFVQPDEEEE